MGIDTATILATMGTVWVGNPISLNPGFSIGGYSNKSNNILGNLLGLLGALSSTLHSSLITLTTTTQENPAALSAPTTGSNQTPPTHATTST